MSKKNRDITADEKDITEIYGTEKEKATDVSKCPSCGANMVFSAEKQLLLCEHCGTEQAFEIQSNEEINFAELLKANNTWSTETHVYSCNNCGAREVLSKEEIAVECSFCGTTNVVESSELSGTKPTAVVPFKISRDAASEKAVKWAKKRFYAPKKFKQSVRSEAIKGTYNPAFTFDTNTVSGYSGRLGKYVYTTKTVNGKTTTTRHTRYFKINGTFKLFFDDILVQASTTISQKVVDKLQPFRTNESSKYNKEFLNGYTANQYTKDGMQCWTEARNIINKRIRSGILSQYDYDVVDSLNISTQCNDITYKYMLLPIYVGHFNWRKKLYNFFVSGFNGKVTGSTPLSKLKIFFTVLAGLAVVAGVAVLAIKFF